MTTVINLFGGPGCGKSTLCAEIYYRLKKAGFKVEMVREYVKDWAWENRKITNYDQLYVLGQQSRKESLLYSKVDYIVTDSPILIGAFYQHYYAGLEIVLPSTLKFMEYARVNGVKYENYFLIRKKPYNPAGRYETEDQALDIDKSMCEWLKAAQQSFYLIDKNDDIKTSQIFHTLNIIA